jgi:hypothetical protein
MSTIDADTDGNGATFPRADVTPVTVPATALESTAPESLRDLNYELASDGLSPARVTLAASFDEDCSFTTQDEAERVREVACDQKAETALRAEHARRGGVRLDVDGPVAV